MVKKKKKRIIKFQIKMNLILKKNLNKRGRIVQKILNETLFY